MMKNILLTFMAFLLFSVTSAFAHDPKSEDTKECKDFHCYRAWRKDWKADKKEFKMHKKMWQDRPWAAARKERKAYKKSWKSERKEWQHVHGYEYHDFWY